MASEDKRLKNRLAQRKYRTNMKKRLQDLEKLAAAAGADHPPPSSQSNTSTTKQKSTALFPNAESGDDQSNIPRSLSIEPSSPTQPSSGVLSISSTAEFMHRASDVDSGYGTNHGNMFPTLEQVVSLPSSLGGDALVGNMNGGGDLTSTERQSLSRESFGTAHGFDLGDAADFTLPRSDIAAAKPWSPSTANQNKHSFRINNGLDQLTDRSRNSYTPILDTHDWQRDRPETTFGAITIQQPFQLRAQPDSEQRIEYILKCVREAGFDDMDSMFSCYYTEQLTPGTAASTAQEKSRSTALPTLLEVFRRATKSWSPWEANAYKNALIRSAERIVSEEFERLEKKIYTSEIEMKNRLTLQRQPHDGSETEARMHREELHRLATEIEANLKNELPNLWGFVTSLTKRKTSSSREAQAGLVLATMKMLARPGDDLIADASDWTRLRATTDNISFRRGSRG